MFDTENLIFFFNRKPVITINKFSHFSRRLYFPRDKENVDTFCLLLYPQEKPNATYLLIIFVKQNIMKNFKNSMLKFN